MTRALVTRDRFPRFVGSIPDQPPTPPDPGDIRGMASSARPSWLTQDDLAIVQHWETCTVTGWAGASQLGPAMSPIPLVRFPDVNRPYPNDPAQPSPAGIFESDTIGVSNPNGYDVGTRCYGARVNVPSSLATRQGASCAYDLEAFADIDRTYLKSHFGGPAARYAVEWYMAINAAATGAVGDKVCGIVIWSRDAAGPLNLGRSAWGDALYSGGPPEYVLRGSYRSDPGTPIGDLTWPGGGTGEVQGRSHLRMILNFKADTSSAIPTKGYNYVPADQAGRYFNTSDAVVVSDDDDWSTWMASIGSEVAAAADQPWGGTQMFKWDEGRYSGFAPTYSGSVPKGAWFKVRFEIEHNTFTGGSPTDSDWSSMTSLPDENATYRVLIDDTLVYQTTTGVLLSSRDTDTMAAWLRYINCAVFSGGNYQGNSYRLWRGPTFVFSDW